jgi:hypothetical protein
MPALTPAAWLQFLEPRLDAQVAAVQGPEDYFNGEHRLAFATAKFREAFSRFFPPLANNWMKIVVEAPVSRLAIQGFRFDPDPLSNTWELDADTDAWNVWQANGMDAMSRIVHTDAIKLGVSYVLIQPPNPLDPYNKLPVLTPEHASQCYVYRNPANLKERWAAIKRWVDDIDGYAYATVYLPTAVYTWRSVEPPKTTTQSGAFLISTRPIQWTRNDADPGGVNPVGVVPLVPIENRPDLLYGGRSDLEEAIPIQDAVNKYCLDMQVSSEFHAYPQRWATGWERTVDETGRELTNREIEIAMGATRIVRSDSKETAFGQWASGDVNNYIAPLDLYIDHLAAITQTPVYYLKGKLANLSADAMHAADQGLVDRVNGKILSFSDGWEEVLRTAFLAMKDSKRGHAQQAEVIWADPESKSLAVLVQSAVQMRQFLSVPIEMCWELLGWSPQKIRQARDMMNLPPGGPVGAATAAPGASQNAQNMPNNPAQQNAPGATANQSTEPPPTPPAPSPNFSGAVPSKV